MNIITKNRKTISLILTIYVKDLIDNDKAFLFR